MCKEKIPDAPLGAPEASSTQRLLVEETPDKEAYFGSFEQDSFDLEDCFNGSTQPENSSLLQNRITERKGVAKNLPKPSTTMIDMGPPGRAESEARMVENISTTVKARTPLKYQAYNLGTICSPVSLEEIKKVNFLEVG